MIAFIGMAAAAARAAGMKTPPDEELNTFNSSDYPHFYVYSNMQLGRRCPSSTSHWHNARLVAGISDDEIKTVTVGMLDQKGFE